MHFLYLSLQLWDLHPEEHVVALLILSPKLSRGDLFRNHMDNSFQQVLTQRFYLTCFLLCITFAVHTAVSTHTGVTLTPPMSEGSTAT